MQYIHLGFYRLYRSKFLVIIFSNKRGKRDVLYQDLQVTQFDQSEMELAPTLTSTVSIAANLLNSLKHNFSGIKTYIYPIKPFSICVPKEKLTSNLQISMRVLLGTSGFTLQHDQISPQKVETQRDVVVGVLGAQLVFVLLAQVGGSLSRRHPAPAPDSCPRGPLTGLRRFYILDARTDVQESLKSHFIKPCLKSFSINATEMIGLGQIYVRKSSSPLSQVG